MRQQLNFHKFSTLLLPNPVTFLLLFLLLTGFLGESFAQQQPQEGIVVGNKSIFTKLVPARQIEQQAERDFLALLTQARNQGVLMGKEHINSQRLIRITQKLLPFAATWNANSKNWRWNIALINSSQINAMCMPGGKIVVFNGIIQKLQLTDDELAMIVGHEISHALREHSNEQIGKDMARRATVNGIASLFDLGALGATLLDMSSKLYSLKFSRDDEIEADLIGMQMAAKAGFNPKASLTLWKKMAAASAGQPPEWFSTHPSDERRFQILQKNIPKVMPFYRPTSAIQ